ncbi:MAG: hypothetical protein IKO64_02755 [Kiritimatiellae bacterium]|nr:hypothetical protein [Kiritimatiellia bacterium]
MKDKSIKLAAAGVAALFAVMVTGCASVKYSSPGALSNISVKGAPGAEAGRHVVISTSGYSVFWCIPVASGDLRWDSEKREIKGGTSLFSDQLGVQELQTALLQTAEARNCNLADVNFHASNGIYAEVSWGGLAGMFFGSADLVVSAVLVPREPIAK